MDVRAAARLIADAVPKHAGVWADLGAGSGTFSIALATLLPAGSRVIAVDLDETALSDLLAHAHALSLGATVETLTANFRESLLVPELDGLLMANSLHYVAYDEQAAFLARLRDRLRSGGRLIVVDYDGRAANQWVPFPVDKRQLARVCAELGWPAPTVVGSRASRYGGSIYAAYIDIPPSATGGERQG